MLGACLFVMTLLTIVKLRSAIAGNR